MWRRAALATCAPRSGCWAAARAGHAWQMDRSTAASQLMLKSTTSIAARMMTTTTSSSSSAKTTTTTKTTPVPPASNTHRVVIVGTGWAGYRLMLQCRKHRAEIERVLGKSMDVVVVSRRNHFLYTPLLASTTVGTLEFRSVIEPVRDAEFCHETDFHYASVMNIDPQHKQLQVQSEISHREYAVDYDTLVLACGAKPMTFGLPGVEENAFFLKELKHARAIRNRIIENFELATQPGVSPEERDRLLHFVVVGGGPTGVEFCAELHDFLKHDLVHKYPQTSKHLNVSLVDAGEILTGFDVVLRNFALNKIKERPNMHFIKKNCASVDKESVTLQGGEKIPCGMVVWTAGVGPNDLTKSLSVFSKSKRGNILTNEYCQVVGAPEIEPSSPFGLPLRSSVFSIGDCAEIQNSPLPATAQKAQSQADYLVKLFRTPRASPTAMPAAYAFSSKGIMAYLGDHQALFEVYKPTSRGNVNFALAKIRGWKAWLLWRTAYFTKLGSWRLRMQVPLDWLKAALVGRDMSHF